MSQEAWVWTFVVLYWAYCIYWGVHGAIRSRTASAYMIAGRQLPMWLFMLAATATSFSGWTFIGHPGLIWRDGLSYAFASFYVLTIPITGTFFAKRSSKGRFKEMDEQGHSLATNRRRKAKTRSKSGYGDKGDRRVA